MKYQIKCVFSTKSSSVCLGEINPSHSCAFKSLGLHIYYRTLICSYGCLQLSFSHCIVRYLKYFLIFICPCYIQSSPMSTRLFHMVITQSILVEINCYPEFSKSKGFHSLLVKWKLMVIQINLKQYKRLKYLLNNQMTFTVF